MVLNTLRIFFWKKSHLRWEDLFMHTEKNSIYLLLGLLLVKFCIVLLLIAFYGVGLAPDEAQYWTWSQALDWGYYSKPPAIAWQIAVTTALLGHSELGVRFGSVCMTFCLPLGLYLGARLMKLGESVCFWAALLFAFSPLGIFLSFMATTDVGAIFFFTLAVLAIAIGVERKEGPSYLGIGMLVLCGALYKWVVYAVWPILLLLLIFFPHLRKKNMVWGVGMSLLALIPAIWWNAAHEWATFRHVGSTIVHSSAKKAGNFGDFFIAQVGLLSPVYFGLLICALGGLFFRLRSLHPVPSTSSGHPAAKNLMRRNPPALLICGIVISFILMYMALAFFKKMQVNWAFFLYPVGFIVLAWWACEKMARGRRWITLGTYSSILCSLCAMLIPYIQEKNIVPAYPVPYKANPFRQNLGWERLATILQDAGYNPEQDFLFGDRYQTASLLSFYGPQQKRAYFFNLQKIRKNQFSYWPQMQVHEVGKTGYFVVLENVDSHGLSWIQNESEKKLRPFFKELEFSGAFPLFEAYGKPVKHALVFRCIDYNGAFPSDPQKF